VHGKEPVDTVGEIRTAMSGSCGVASASVPCRQIWRVRGGGQYRAASRDASSGLEEETPRSSVLHHRHGDVRGGGDLLGPVGGGRVRGGCPGRMQGGGGGGGGV
jgi:hypothetical protein